MPWSGLALRPRPGGAQAGPVAVTTPGRGEGRAPPPSWGSAGVHQDMAGWAGDRSGSTWQGKKLLEGEVVAAILFLGGERHCAEWIDTAGLSEARSPRGIFSGDRKDLAMRNGGLWGSEASEEQRKASALLV